MCHETEIFSSPIIVGLVTSLTVLTLPVGTEEEVSVFLCTVSEFTTLAKSDLLTATSCAAGPESADSFEATGVSCGLV